MSDSVTLLGLDFGTTTSSAVVATANIARSVPAGRMQLTDICETYRSPMVFTPWDEAGRLDGCQMEFHLDSWLGEGRVPAESLFGGGALLTGLAAKAENAQALVRLLRHRLRDALVATADDPCLESWLSFMGSCASLSRSRPRQSILNLDIGGGTTNLALGVHGQVLRTGCLFVGARHVRVVPGSYRLVALSRYARALFEHLGLHRNTGECLTEADVQSILDFYLALLQAAATGDPEGCSAPVARLHVQVPFDGPVGNEVAITFSGGVGELIYRHVQDGGWPATTCFGDLGIDLAQRLVESPWWSKDLQTLQLSSAGRATAYGLLRHNTEVSGSTLYLPSIATLPWTNVPILGTLSLSSDDRDLHSLLDLARRSSAGGCIRVEVDDQGAQAVGALGRKLARGLRTGDFPPTHRLLLLVAENVGKALGNYVTEWGALPLNLIVIDEIAPRNAQYVQVGALRGQVVPVSFHGLN